ncbi:hypothetical protein DFH09DRAFT_1096985 [Mycena vulgaris]|nr:hypothetical protein DFH09DRAFT_1096985 [Mycena vulgaris]
MPALVLLMGKQRSRAALSHQRLPGGSCPNWEVLVAIFSGQALKDLSVVCEKRAKENLGALEQSKIKLQKECDSVLNEVNDMTLDDPTSAESARATQAASLQKEVVKIISLQRDKCKMCTKVRFRTEMDRITKFSLVIGLPDYKWPFGTVGSAASFGHGI